MAKEHEWIYDLARKAYEAYCGSIEGDFQAFDHLSKLKKDAWIAVAEKMVLEIGG